MRLGLPSCVALSCICAVSVSTLARANADIVDQAFQVFYDNCLNPHLMKTDLEAQLTDGIRVDFYDLKPFSARTITPVTGRAATPDTDRRCEVAFDADLGGKAAELAADALLNERIMTQTPLPTTHTNAGLHGTTLLAARKLNPNRIAVVHTGTRPSDTGIETFLMVERLTPEASSRHK